MPTIPPIKKPTSTRVQAPPRNTGVIPPRTGVPRNTGINPRAGSPRASAPRNTGVVPPRAAPTLGRNVARPPVPAMPTMPARPVAAPRPATMAEGGRVKKNGPKK